VTGWVCFICDARHGEARGRSDLLEEVVDVEDVVHAVVDVVFDAVADVSLVAVVGDFVAEAAVVLSQAVVVTVVVSDT